MTHDPGRPDPDALLAAINRDVRPADRGRFKVFFGFSPGVGKTCAMLQAARQMREQGSDVVAGIIETHGREETARLLDGIPVLPRLDVPYRGHVLREFDLDGAIARRPDVLLVDELAHTNAPGLRHEKRWQDIFDVLACGIDVHTTLNVQHVESLVDLVEQATGIRVRETVPDTVLDRADEIELVDLPPDELLERLREGKIYLPDVAQRATERFFRRTNLLQLRELALVRMARRAGADAAETRRESPGHATGVTERIVVGVGPGHGSTRAIRDAARIAAGLRADWSAVTVRTPFARTQRAADAALEANLRLAESLGGRVDRLDGVSVAATLLEEARRLSATRIVVGRPRSSGWWRPLRERILDRLVETSGGIDIIVASSPTITPRAATPRPRVVGLDLPVAVAAIVSATVAAVFVLGRMMRPWVDDHDMAVVSLLLVVAATLRFGRGAGMLAVALSGAGIDLLFLHPEFHLAVSDAKELVSLLLLLSVGLVVAEMAMRIRAQRESALQSERRVTRLLELSRRLASAAASDDVAAALSGMAADVTSAAAEVMITTPTGELRTASRVGAMEHVPADAGVEAWCHEFGEPAGRGTATLRGARITCLPIREAGRGFGVLVIGCSPPRDLTRDEIEMLESGTRQAALRLTACARDRG